MSSSSASSANTTGPVSLFYSYSHKDEGLRRKLEEALALLKRQGYIAAWHDRMIGAGDEWKGEIDKNLEEAQLILLLVSASFLASDYCYDIEMKRAIERHEAREARVIPVVLRPCEWQRSPLARLQSFPTNGRAITLWRNRDQAFTDVAEGIRKAVEAIPPTPPTCPPPGIDGKTGVGERDPSSGGTIERSDSPGEHARQGIRENIEGRLKRLKPEVQRDLAQELLGTGERPPSEPAALLSNLVTILLESRSLSTIADLAQIENRLCDRSDWEQAEIVSQIGEEVTPLVIDDERARQLWNDIHQRNSAFVAVPDRYSTTLEVLMARADGKGMKFKTPKTEAAIDDYEGTPLLQPSRKSPVGAPETVESVAKSILVDLCEGQSVRDSDAPSVTLDELVQRLAGVLIDHSRGVNKNRTLYCFHKMPAQPGERSVHENALRLVRDELDRLKGGGSREWENFPRFVFLLLSEKSELEGLRSIIVRMLERRSKHARRRGAHGASE